jgi:hypothetical protein
LLISGNIADFDNFNNVASKQDSLETIGNLSKGENPELKPWYSEIRGRGG